MKILYVILHTNFDVTSVDDPMFLFGPPIYFQNYDN